MQDDSRDYRRRDRSRDRSEEDRSRRKHKKRYRSPSSDRDRNRSPKGKRCKLDLSQKGKIEIVRKIVTKKKENIKKAIRPIPD